MKKKRLIAVRVAILFACMFPVFGSMQASLFAQEGTGDGAALFDRECSRCHEIGTGARNKVGPHLDTLFGRVAGSVEGFRYSNAMKEAGEEGLVWDAAALAEYIEKPRTFINGNRMSYRGLADEGKRQALVAWLATASKSDPVLGETASASEGAAPGFTEIILKIDGDPDYGEYLAGECVTCHQSTGQVEGIPSIVGVPKDYFVRSLVEYQTNVRTNEVMKLRVQNLTNDEIAALAAYFSGLEPQ